MLTWPMVSARRASATDAQVGRVLGAVADRSLSQPRQLPLQPACARLLVPGATHPVGLATGAALGRCVLDELLGGLDMALRVVVLALDVGPRIHALVCLAIADEAAEGFLDKVQQPIDFTLGIRRGGEADRPENKEGRECVSHRCLSYALDLGEDEIHQDRVVVGA